jgi:hypothetical protein
MVRWLLLVAVLAALAASGHAAPVASACHPDRFLQQRVNLDRDTAKEEVIAVDSHDCRHTSFKAYVHIRDRCDGIWHTYDLNSDAQVLEQFKIVNADGWTKRPEVFFVTRRLGSPPSGIAEVVRLDQRSGCARVHTLFAYSPQDASLRGFAVELKNAAERYRGLEIVLTKTYATSERVLTYRYDVKLDRYVVY